MDCTINNSASSQMLVSMLENAITMALSRMPSIMRSDMLPQLWPELFSVREAMVKVRPNFYNDLNSMLDGVEEAMRRTPILTFHSLMSTLIDPRNVGDRRQRLLLGMALGAMRGIKVFVKGSMDCLRVDADWLMQHPDDPSSTWIYRLAMQDLRIKQVIYTRPYLFSYLVSFFLVRFILN